MTNATFSRAELLQSGWTDVEIRGLLDEGRLERLRYGVYCSAREITPEERHRQLIEATWKVVGDENVLSHTSAALVHGLPVRREALRRVTLTRLTPGHGDRQQSVLTRNTRITAPEYALREGIPTTTLTRTATDVARTEPQAWGLAAVDAALHSGAEVGELLAGLAMHPRLRGLPRARRILQLASPLAESPLESISRWNMTLAGFPSPVLQHEHFDENGEFVARTDFYWPEHRLVGECDGMFKYTKLLRPGETTEDAIRRQQEREQRLRALGLWIVNWDWGVGTNPAQLEQRLRRAFAAAA